MAIIQSLLSWFNVKRIEQINLYTSYPNEIQQETLYKLVQTAKETEWGTNHGFKDIAEPRDFQRNNPITDYNMLKPYIERVRNGESEVLWPGSTKWFAKSSGTTDDKSKFIPVSKEALEECHFRAGKDVCALYISQMQETKLYRGKSLVLGGSHQISNISYDSYFGDLSAILIQNLPFWTQFYRTPDISIALMDEWERKIELMANETIAENVVSIAGVPSWTMVLFKKILEITGKQNICEVWPNIELFVHGGVNFAPYREQYAKFLPSPSMRYMETYNASEGFFAIQNDLSTNDMLLMLDLGIFYEFIPMEDIDSENPRCLFLDEVQLGQNYAMLITTNSGLWRYKIGDTVTFTSRYPFKIKITGRTKHFINAFGEELIIDNAEKALAVACQRTSAQIRDYTAAPLFMSSNSKGAHQWLIEWEQEPSDLNHFTELLDGQLKSLNSDYEAKRYKNMTLIEPQVVSLKSGTFYQWLKQKGKLGGQHKIPRLSNTRDHASEILAIHFSA